MIESALLYVFCALAVASAAAMILVRHPMRVAVALITCMMSLAAIYALVGVHVIAIFQVLIYVGAVMVFMVYAIMLLDVRDYSFTRRFSWLLLPGAVAAVVFVAILAHGLWQALPNAASGGGSALFGVKRFSIEFLNDFWLHFELVSILLVAAVVAALAVLQVGRRKHG